MEQSRASLPKIQGLFLQLPSNSSHPEWASLCSAKPFSRTLAPALTWAEGVALQRGLLFATVLPLRGVWGVQGLGREKGG